MELLDLDLNSVDTSLPLLQPGVYKLQIVDSIVEPNSAGDGHIWRLRLETTEPATGMRDEQLPARFPIFTVLSLTPKGNATQEMIARNVASVVQALTPPLEERVPVRAIFDGSWPEVARKFVGRYVEARVGVQPERTDERTGRRFAAQNTIDRFIKAER